MQVKTGEFWVIDGKVYAEYISYGSTQPGTPALREKNEELQRLFDQKCKLWQARHPNGHRDVADPDDADNYLMGGTVMRSRTSGTLYVSMDPGIDDAVIPEINAAFGLDGVEDVEYARHGQKWCFFNFTDWLKEHPDFKTKK